MTQTEYLTDTWHVPSDMRRLDNMSCADAIPVLKEAIKQATTKDRLSLLREALRICEQYADDPENYLVMTEG